MPTTGFWSEEPDQWDNTGAVEEQVPVHSSVRTEVHRQFWRESEQAWVDHVLIHRDEVEKSLRWRHRTYTITTEIGPWEDGKS